MWSSFKGTIMYRGTMTQLENENVRLKLVSHSLIFSSTLSEKIVNLQGIFDFERIKTDFTLIDDDTKDKYSVAVEGFVNIDHKIKYKQIGDNVTLFSKRKYLCINIMRVENIRPAETRGIVDSFISVEYVSLFY